MAVVVIFISVSDLISIPCAETYDFNIVGISMVALSGSGTITVDTTLAVSSAIRTCRLVCRGCALSGFVAVACPDQWLSERVMKQNTLCLETCSKDDEYLSMHVIHFATQAMAKCQRVRYMPG